MSGTKKPLTTPIILAAGGALAGLFLLIKPGASLGAVIRFIGWAMIIDGAIRAVKAFLRGERNRMGYMIPAVQIVSGIAFMAIARILIGIVPVLIGSGLIGLAAYKIRLAMIGKKNAGIGKKDAAMFAAAALSAVVGIYVIFHPAVFTSTLIRLLGGYILLESAEDLIAYLWK
ncbi:MAG: DUF308 domain-containing protein [Clostridia bacterium]|nr:DUF308 domain-containing protein [Clostridia bacterium]